MRQQSERRETLQPPRDLRWAKVIALVALSTLALSGCATEGDLGRDLGDAPILPGSADGWSDGAWVVEQDWSDEEEALFSEFVEALGRSRAAGQCSALYQCLRSPEANLLWDERDQDLWIFADCADLPMILRAYFASKRRLPFSFVSAISTWASQ